MSQDLGQHHSVFSFPITQQEQDHEQQHHIAQQIRREKLRLQGLQETTRQQTPLVGIDEEGTPVYEATGMLSEMFNFPMEASGGGATSHLLQHHQATQSGGWYGGVTAKVHQAAMNESDSMQLFLMNPTHPATEIRSPSPHPNSASTSTLHMLLPNQNPNHQNTSASLDQGYRMQTHLGFDTVHTLHSEPGVVEGRGLSLSLSSSLEAAKFRNMGSNHTMMHHLYTDNQLRPPAAEATTTAASRQTHPIHVASLGVVNVLRNSKYLKAAQELLEEFCSVGRGQYFKNKTNQVVGSGRSNPNNASSSNYSSSTTKDTSPLSAADRMEHQRRKVKLLAMLDEVDGRYNHYCEQMQMVKNSFDLVMGLRAALPYTALAQKAMSRHFRCLKDAIAAQFNHSCELLGDGGGRSSSSSSGITKGETPRLKMLDHNLRQQRDFHPMDQDAWRPQRGLPDRSVTLLRAWLFEHFLHPYPSDADKHLLARQTGLSRNQVSNWFINARVRLWKPMVEEMYQQEAKEVEDDQDHSNNQQQRRESRNPSHNSSSSSPPSSTAPCVQKRSHKINNASESDPSFFLGNQPPSSSATSEAVPTALHPQAESYVNHHHHQMKDIYRRVTDTSFGDIYGSSSGNDELTSATLIRFGPSSGDISLTLGLRHAGNVPPDDNNTTFSMTDFGDS